MDREETARRHLAAQTGPARGIEHMVETRVPVGSVESACAEAVEQSHPMQSAATAGESDVSDRAATMIRTENDSRRPSKYTVADSVQEGVT